MRELFEYGGARMPVSFSAHIDYQSPTGFITPLDYQPAIITTHEEPTEIGLNARPSTWSRNTARVQHMQNEKVAVVRVAALAKVVNAKLRKKLATTTVRRFIINTWVHNKDHFQHPIITRRVIVPPELILQNGKYMR